MLVGRGLLRAQGPLLETASADSLRFASHDIERDVLRLYLGGRATARNWPCRPTPCLRAAPTGQLDAAELLLGPPLLRERERITWVAHYLLLTVAVKAVIIGNGHWPAVPGTAAGDIFLLKLRGLRKRAASWGWRLC